jgi:cytochrome c peroxidase
MSGSRLVQELSVDLASRPFVVKPTGRTFATRERPFALALDGNRLYVADWGGEVLEAFDLGTGARTAEVDLGYALPRYPATNIERGEHAFYDASWSNNGRKTCATCHVDELDTDGIGYANGATAPTAYHQVKPNHNLMTTDSFFWNGSFRNGNYASLAFAAQTRTNCEVIQLGLVEGPASDPNTRVGDPNNQFRIAAQDPQCRPQVSGPGTLANAAAIATVVNAERAIADQRIQERTGFDKTRLSRFIDFYSVAELRLPPNPLTYHVKANELTKAEADKVVRGQEVFASAGCATCHQPDNARHPFSDGKNHGPGADWVARFIAEYKDDPRLRAILPDGIPQGMIDGSGNVGGSRTVNFHTPLDDFLPFCFTATSCLEIADPLAVKANAAEETRRLELLVRFNLVDPQRGFVPGNVSGQARVNTPSLRGVWTQANLLHHGLARTVNEAILGPGHSALTAGERGFAVDTVGLDPHGATSKLPKADVEALVRYVESIE